MWSNNAMPGRLRRPFAGFAALGFFFGKEINRARAEAAERRAGQSEAATRQATDREAAGRERLAALTAMIEERAASREGSEGPDASRPQGDWQELARVARRLAAE